MKRSPNEVKWYAYKPEGSNGYWHVITQSRFTVCSCYVADSAEQRAKRIAKDHNEMLKIKRSLTNTPFKK